MNAEQHAEALNIDADGIVRYAKKDKHDALEQMKQSEWEEGPGGLRFKSRGPSRFAYNGMKLPDRKRVKTKGWKPWAETQDDRVKELEMLKTKYFEPRFEPQTKIFSEEERKNLAKYPDEELLAMCGYVDRHWTRSEGHKCPCIVAKAKGISFVEAYDHCRNAEGDLENVQHEFLPALRTADPADDFETASITKEDSRLDKEANDGTQVIEDFYAKSRQWVEMMHEAYNIPTFYSKTPLRQLLHAQQPEQTQAVAAIHATVKALYDHALENWAAAHRQYTLRQDYPSMLDYTFKELKACLDENDSDFQKCARKDSEASEDEKRLMDINHSESLTVKDTEKDEQTTVEDYVNRLTKQAILKVLWADDHSYLRCKHDPMASLPVCVSTSLKPDIEKARLTASQNDTIKAEPMHIIYSGIFSIMVGLGVFFLVFLSRRGGARNQRRRTVRHLVDIHPKDRSAEVKRLADQLGLMSMYDEGETEKYSDAVADKEMSPGVGA